MTLDREMASPAAEIVPELLMPPPALLLPNRATLETLMPEPTDAEIVPLLPMPPKKLPTSLTSMPA
ncbi:MAG: hypothetical protein WBD71_07215 [Xanthobacteraceae bacterium]